MVFEVQKEGGGKDLWIFSFFWDFFLGCCLVWDKFEYGGYMQSINVNVWGEGFFFCRNIWSDIEDIFIYIYTSFGGFLCLRELVRQFLLYIYFFKGSILYFIL